MSSISYYFLCGGPCSYLALGKKIDPKKATKWLQIFPYFIIPSYMFLYTLKVLLVANLPKV